MQTWPTPLSWTCACGSRSILSAPELHSLRWETIADPNDPVLDPQKPRYLAREAQLPFSRFLTSSDRRQVVLRQKGKLRALVVIANPSELGARDIAGSVLPKVDDVGEKDRAKKALEDNGVPITWLISSNAPVTMEAIKLRLKERFDILYLVCHGAMLRDEDTEKSPLRPRLVLEKANGKLDLAYAEDLATAIREMHPADRPRLVVLASCQSGGQGVVLPPVVLPSGETTGLGQGILPAAGPLLVDAGVPAVVAMQGKISVETVKQFMPVFFKGLLTHGQVDRAAAEARSAVSTQDDWWAPVLYLRLVAGLLWYDSGFSDDTKEYSWMGMLDSIEDAEHRRVPILGPGLIEGLIGTPEEIALNFPDNNRFPFLPHNQQDLPQVAQFMVLRDGEKVPRNAMAKYINEKLCARCKEKGIDPQGLTLTDLVSKVSEMDSANENDPHHVLARLPFTIFINTTPDTLLEQALKRVRKNCQPQSVYSCWKTSLVTQKTVEKLASLVEPDYQHPLVLYLFGRLDVPSSWVLSEDDYFEYLLWVNSASNSIPQVVQAAWVNNPLLFLGFKMSDWDFRVLFHSILPAERLKQQNRDYHSVAVQFQPGDDNLRPARAQDLLQDHFKSNNFDLYWGSAENYLTLLWEEWKKDGRKIP